MKSDKLILGLIEEIKDSETVTKDDMRGLTRITPKGKNWIEALEWVLEKN